MAQRRLQKVVEQLLEMAAEASGDTREHAPGTSLHCAAVLRRGRVLAVETNTLGRTRAARLGSHCCVGPSRSRHAEYAALSRVQRRWSTMGRWEKVTNKARAPVGGRDPRRPRGTRLGGAAAQ